MTTQNNHKNEYYNSPAYEKDWRYWSRFVLDSRNYIKFYNIKNSNYSSKRIDINRIALTNFLKQEKCSLFEFYGSVFALYLSRINRLEGCLLKTSLPLGNREVSAVSTLLRIDIDKKGSFKDLLRTFNSAYNEAVYHTRIDVENYMENNHLDEKVTFYHIYDCSKTDYDVNPLLICNDDSDSNITDHNSALTLNINNDSLELLYNTDLFSDVYIDHMVKNIESLTESVINSPGQIIIDIDILSKEEKDLISVFSKGKDVKVDETVILSQAFRDYAVANPDALAIDDGVTTITYGQLERSSNSLADDLYKNYNVRPGSRVALMLPRNYHFPEMVLALNKLGAAYIPIDTQFPANRIGHMISIAQAEHFVTLKSLGETLDLNTHMIYMEDLDPSKDVDVDILCKVDDLLIILFTSGTTGIPKGVMFTNRQIALEIVNFDYIFHFSTGDLVGLFASFSFSASIVFYGVFSMGLALRLFNEEEQRNSMLLMKALKEKHMNSVILPPAVGIALYENEDLNLDYVLLAGAKLNKLSKKERHTRLINAYGATEVLIAISTEIDLKSIKDDRVPIGKPMPNTYAYILDSDGHQMPVGIPGEICISGSICSPGYYNDPELTSKSFVDNPYSDRETTRKMYRTGDIGFYNFDGEIEYIGREDNQLSVRGFRIESDEILGIMKRFPEISDIYLDAFHDNLTAYYTAADNLDIDQVKDALENELPYYMIPSLFIKLEKIPLNINGKIDRSGIKRVIAQKDIEIADDILRSVMDAFKEVLHLDVVFMDDKFVSLGGNSLSAMKLQISLHDKLGVSLSSNELIGLSTPKDIANHIKYSINVQTTANENRYSFDGACPLSESQLNVYLDESMHDMGTGYNNPFIIRFKDENKYSAEEIKNALIKLFEVFPVLKGRVLNREDSLAMVFDAEPAIKSNNHADIENEIETFVKKFELDKGLSRFLITEENGSMILCVDIHHLIFDGASLNVFLKIFLSLLNRADIDHVDTGALREVSFEEIVYSGNMDEASAFFEGMLADKDEVYDLIPSIDGDDKTEYIDTFDMDMEDLNSFLRSHSMTYNQFFASVFAYTLSRFSGSEKVFFNLIEDGRGHIDLSRSVGMFVKTLPVLMDCKDQDLDSFLAYSSDLINSVMKNDLYPFRILAGKYDLNANIQFQYSHDLFAGAVNNDGLDYEIEELEHDLNADFSFNILNTAVNKFTISILGSSLYGKDFIHRFAQSYKMILRGMMEAEKLGDICYIGESDITLLDRFNQTETPIRQNDILDAFNDILSKYPDNKLVEYGDVSYTFAQGAFIGNKIRQKLLALGVDSQDKISFLVPRSELYMFCVLGIMSAGAAYVPLDDTLPDERIRFMIRDTGSKIMIVSDDTLKRAEELAIPGLTLFNVSDIMKDEIGNLKHLPVQYGDLACILYTSGSTGIPKGAKITRKSVLYFTDFNVKYLGLLPGDVYGFYTSVGFDVSIEALFSTMYSGACMDVIPECIRLDIQALNRHFIEHNVTYIDITTQVAKIFISQVEDTSLKILLTGGEKLGQVDETRQYRIVDSYGPTEAVDYVTLIDIKDRIDPSSVGYPNNNTKAYILDKELRRVPVGAVGGLYFSGPQLADGYLDREEETARGFINNPFEENEEYRKLYSTGDVARVLPDGTYGIIGRRDGQVKIRGNRVELTAVDACLRKMDIIKDVTTKAINKNGNNELVAYVVSDDLDETALADAVCEYLSGRVPGYMIPSFVIKLDQIPLNVNGKVDKGALPDVDPGKYHAEYAAPMSKLEKIIVSGFEKVFNLDKISVNDDFLRLGGDSLIAVRLLSIIGDYGITIGEILSLRTPAAIAANVKDTSFNLDVYTLETGCPLNNVQRYIYNDIVRNNKYDAYLIPSIIPISGKYSNEQIEKALDMVFTAHPILTMHVEEKDGRPYLVKGKKPAVMKGSCNPLKMLSFLTSDFSIYESLSKHLVVRIPGKCYLVSLIHHMLCDVTSENNFRRALYRALEGTPLDYVDDAFLRFSAYHQQIQATPQFDEADRFLRSSLENINNAGFLPKSGKSGKPGYLVRDLDVDQDLMKRFSDKYGVSKNIFFTAALACTLSKLTGKDDVFFGYVDIGRDKFKNYDSIGLFINTMPLITHVKKQSLRSFLENLTDHYYKLMSYDYYPGGPLYQEYNISPVMLFQFLPDWVIGDGGYEKLPVNESLINTLISTQKNILVDALMEVVQAGDSYTLRIMHSGFFSRKAIIKLADTYQKALSYLLKQEY